VSSRFESLTGVLDKAFLEYDMPPAEPMDLAQQWISSAVEEGVREPLALALATADSSGHASNRTVAIVEVTGQGVVFTSHSTSQKGREIAETGWASGLLYWRETARQLIIAGPVVLLSELEADRLWAARPAPLHAMSTASWQSEPIDDVSLLQAEADRLSMYGDPLPRPARFAGYRLEPAMVEFWSAAPGRLHRRLRYDKTPAGWRTVRLQP
jgi:pyridoxamine-phosphate oxidase